MANTFTALGVNSANPANIGLADAHILVGGSDGRAHDVAMSGGATINDTGVVTVSAAGSWTLIEKKALTNQTAITFNIAAAYRIYLIVMRTRPTSTVPASVIITFNGDSGNNYSYTKLAGTTINESTAQANIRDYFHYTNSFNVGQLILSGVASGAGYIMVTGLLTSIDDGQTQNSLIRASWKKGTSGNITSITFAAETNPIDADIMLYYNTDAGAV